MAKSVEKKAFDKSEYYNEEGDVIYCEDTEILFQGEPGGRKEPIDMEEGGISLPKHGFTIPVYSGNMWSQKVCSWPWSHANKANEYAKRFMITEDPAEHFAENYNYYADAWVRDIPAEVWMFLASRPMRLIPSKKGDKGLHAAIKIHEEPEKGKELIKALSEACASYRKYVKSSRKLGIHGYDEGPRRPKTIMMDAAIRMREKLGNIETQFNRIRWLEYNIRFRNDMNEWEEYFGEESYHQEWVMNTADSFMKIGKILGQEELANEEEE